MPKITSSQRRGQAHIASENIRREARRIATERNISEDAAEIEVFKDTILLAKCHGQVPKAAEIEKDWREPHAPESTVAVQNK